ncbi:3-isopropylmalate dehydrogenase [Clostridium saccharobutylicum]|uniref:3-isopropylmalate dehydrogenase n=1 Tax=Clostridium saccharobutylicum DSM 13864 TaxID=1345695 RepID=U5MLB6_CLOSA|nr:3-isopropylmalate dehydrogenase [Clostridium saccharobutylicum]AGX41323.1 3-isopropylmalate dehydrogenase LeuB [Clostridium saccharobutylicum DSM 13864]AQR88609.1 3-isopropylmalate dehydrogenase [Clostridium saccharobutylicum]AQR98507.1 3-isopropylmalate dehydrogenase [Clostridium saccharobutylicum]AQS08219.1 3-isopropylmalate dehydrogenase [Clostridium saccharobutylicum]AQS12497.1 3-isopropylmalate dehydrogenase [Clostridium saccharobutylicum]
MKYNIAVIEGDGIGPDIVTEAIKVLNTVGEKFNHKFEYEYVLMGGCAIDKEGTPLPEATLDVCKKSDAVLLGAVGGPKWDDPDSKVRPEQGLLGLRNGLKLYCNLRPAVLYAPLKNESPLKDEIVKNGIDICIVRELTGGIYFGERGTEVIDGVKSAYDTERYNVNEIRRIAKIAFETAMKRNKKLTSVDKANILDSSKLWRSIVNEMAKDYPEVEVNHLYVDNTAMQLVKDPTQFDVIVTSNMFGDILSDEASMVTGSIGMLPSASLGDGTLGVYEPIHGSAPDIAGMGIANPLATILSTAMMLRHSFSLEKEAKIIENAVLNVLEDGYRTGDIMTEGKTKVGTVEMGDLVCKKIKEGK